MIKTLHNEKGFIRKNSVLLIIFVSIFCLIFIINKPVASVINSIIITLLSPFQNAYTSIGNSVILARKFFSDVSQIRAENKQLQEEITKLRLQNSLNTELTIENQQFRDSLKYKESQSQFDLMVARIIGKDSAVWSQIVIVDRGTSDGVQQNMIVVSSEGLVGRVIETGLNSSKIMLLIDSRSSISALIQRPESRITGVLEGDVKNPFNPKMINIPKDSDIQIDDVIITSGYGGFYPKGIIIGKIVDIKNEESGLLEYGVIAPSVNFRNLETVMIVLNSKKLSSSSLIESLEEFEQ